jgi:hypothetical protein
MRTECCAFLDSSGPELVVHPRRRTRPGQGYRRCPTGNVHVRCMPDDTLLRPIVITKHSSCLEHQDTPGCSWGVAWSTARDVIMVCLAASIVSKHGKGKLSDAAV